MYQGYYYLHIALTVGGEHRAKVIVHCIGHVIVGGDNSSIESFEWPYVVPFNSSLIYIRVEAFGIVFTNFCNT